MIQRVLMYSMSLLCLLMLPGCPEPSQGEADMQPAVVMDMTTAPQDMSELTDASMDSGPGDQEDLTSGQDADTSDMEDMPPEEMSPNYATICEAYCALMLANCTQDNEVFASTQACSDACGSYPDYGVCEDFNDPSSCEDVYDTVQCRLHHAALSKDDPAANCPQAAPRSLMANGNGGACVDLSL